jgi:hypothetical protein
LRCCHSNRPCICPLTPMALTWTKKKNNKKKKMWACYSKKEKQNMEH